MKRKILEKFKKKSPKLPVIIAHKSIDFSWVDKKHIVLLTPAFYWYKQSDLAFKNLKTAKRVAKSIFFGWIPEGEYNYYAFKEGSDFGFIAFDSKKVLDELASQGLDPKYIDRIVFAQSSLKKSINNIKIDDNFSLKYIGDSFVVVPDRGIESDPINDLDFTISYKPSRGSIEIGDKKPLIAVAVVTLLFSAGLTIDLIRKNSLINKLEIEKEQIVFRSKLPATTMQLNSILTRLEQTKKEQTAIRENLSKLLSLNLSSAIIVDLRVSTTSIIAVIETRGLDNEAKVAQLIRKEFAKSAVATRNNTLAVEIKW